MVLPCRFIRSKNFQGHQLKYETETHQESRTPDMQKPSNRGLIKECMSHSNLHCYFHREKEVTSQEPVHCSNLLSHGKEHTQLKPISSTCHKKQDSVQILTNPSWPVWWGHRGYLNPNPYDSVQIFNQSSWIPLSIKCIVSHTSHQECKNAMSHCPRPNRLCLRVDCLQLHNDVSTNPPVTDWPSNQIHWPGGIDRLGWQNYRDWVIEQKGEKDFFLSCPEQTNMALLNLRTL